MDKKNKKPVLIVIAGPNGSGKTSVTAKILHHEWMEDSVYINPNIVAQERFGDWNSKEAIMQSVKLYDNSIDNVEQKLLIRLSDGNIVKQYVEIFPEWAKQIIE